MLTAEQEARLAQVTNLHRGKGRKGLEDACVMQAVDWVYRNEDHFTDSPECVSPVIAEFMRSWNDSMNDEDRQKLKVLIPVLIGTKTNAKDERTRSYMALDWYCRVSTPAWLRLIGKDKEARAIEKCAPIVDAKSAKAAQGALDEARTVAYAAGAAAWAAARAAAGAAAWAAAGAAAWAAARAAAGAAAWAAARAAAWAAARAAAGDAAWDAAGAALRPTVIRLQDSAIDLVRRMAAVGR